MHIMRQLRNAPPSNIGKTKSDKVSEKVTTFWLNPLIFILVLDPITKFIAY